MPVRPRLRAWSGAGRRRLVRALDPRGESRIGMDVTLEGLADRDFAPTHVLDVGAAAGTWTELALRQWPAASYLMVEPLEDRRPELESVCARNPKVEWVQAAAGRAAGHGTLNIARDLDSSSLLYKGVAEREVPLVTLDGVLAARDMETPQLVKLDVQGYELEVLSGAQRVLEQGELILLEAALFRWAPGTPLLQDVIAWMAERGWRPYELVDVLRRPLDGATGQCDVLFAREHTPLLAVDRWG